MVRLILHGELRQYAPGKVLEVHGTGLTVHEVLAAVGVPAEAAAAYVVNGEQCEPTARLADGDTIEVLPAISGGAGGALDGIRVIDLTRALAGPYCTLMLADHGADVIKIELPGSGDETRDWAPPHVNGVSAYYLSINRNKRSLTLDLKHPEGKKVLEDRKSVV